MGLPALEFSDCCLDSPHFRETLKSHEAELDKTNKFIKELIKDGKSLVSALKNLSSAKRKFADSLNEFKFQCIGDAETDDEMCIARSLQEFATVLRNLEDERIRMIENASEVLITPLEKFRKEQIGAAKEAKKKYDKETEKYCGILEKHLNLSSKKKESQLQEADSQVDLVRQHFYEVSLEYVFKVQEVQERKMFEFVEPLLAFLQGLFTFYHHGYELAKDFNDFKTQLTISIQNTRNRFEGTRSEVESLMKKMKENPLEHKTISPYTMEGYLYVQEKRHFGTSWVKHYCTYQRDSKQITMVPFDQKSGGKGGEDESVTLKSCTRRKTDSIEKRFCFDVEAVDRPGVITMQALSEEDRRLWMEAMDGREPCCVSGIDTQSELLTKEVNFMIVRLYETMLIYTMDIQKVQCSCLQKPRAISWLGKKMEGGREKKQKQFTLGPPPPRDRPAVLPRPQKFTEEVVMRRYEIMSEKSLVPFGERRALHLLVLEQKRFQNFGYVKDVLAGGGQKSNQFEDIPSLQLEQRQPERREALVPFTFLMAVICSFTALIATGGAIAQGLIVLQLCLYDSQNFFKAAQLDSIGFSIIRKCIHAVETRGINEQGLYRIVGVNSRVQKLLSILMASETETDICAEWEIKTITSALKTYLRMLPGPLMMYQFQRSFIKAAKLENQESRVSEIHSLVHRLPEKNRQMLQLLMNHLANVANNHKQNLMTVANLGVVFGPTLLRPQEETVAAIMDIKFQNIVIEILIENHEKLLSSAFKCTHKGEKAMRKTLMCLGPPIASESCEAVVKNWETEPMRKSKVVLVHPFWTKVVRKLEALFADNGLHLAQQLSIGPGERTTKSRSVEMIAEGIFNTVPDAPLTNAQLHLSRKKSSDSKPPSCSERPLTLFHAMQSTEKQEQRNSLIDSSLESVVSSNANSILNSSSSLQPNVNSSDPDLDVLKPTRPNSLENSSQVL
ncbi:hypothetical protein EI555_018744 [Monodon monoceros]|uniref:Rho GTPase-activating protein 26 n=1 Tax=Monodon monoceros TaxID=40151 RepID=A0A4U1FNV0_MONMO|nr:hypothetical protein EI555_018744 [Monodon monoceros]